MLYVVSMLLLVWCYLCVVSMSRLLMVRWRLCRLVMGEMIGVKIFDSKLLFFVIWMICCMWFGWFV